MRLLTSPYVLMTVAMLFWAGNWLLARALRADVTPIGLNFWRWLVALGLLAPFALPRLPAALPLLRHHWRLMLALGFLGVALFQPLVYLALEYTTAINAAVFNTTGPVLIVCISWVLFRDTVTRRQGLGIALSLVGVLAIVTRGDPAVLLRLRFNPGDLWALASVPVWGLYTVLLKRRPPELDALVFLAATAAVGVVLMAPVYAWDVASGGRMAFTPATVATIAYVALFASVLAFVFWNSAVPRVGPNKAGLFLHLHPAFTTVLAIVFLGERLHEYHGFGIVLIVLGIYLTSAAPGPAREREGAAPERNAPVAAPAAAPATAAGPLARSPLGLLTSPYLLLVLNMAFWAGNWIVSRSLRGEITPLGLNFWRWTLALAWVLPFTWRDIWRARAAIRREWKLLVALGVLSVSVFNLLIYLAVAHTTAINGVLITSSTPVVIVLFSWLLLRERVTARQTAGVLVSLGGVLLIITRGDPALLLQVRFNVGDLWSLAAVPVWALYSVLLRRRPPELSPMALLGVMVGIGVLVLLPFSLYAHAQAPQVHLTPQTAGGIIYVALFASLLGVAFYNHGVARLGPNVTGLFIHLVPVFTTALAWLVLGEALRLHHLGGIVLIFTGIYLTSTAARRAGAPKAQPEAIG